MLSSTSYPASPALHSDSPRESTPVSPHSEKIHPMAQELFKSTVFYLFIQASSIFSRTFYPIRSPVPYFLCGCLKGIGIIMGRCLARLLAAVFPASRQIVLLPKTKEIEPAHLSNIELIRHCLWLQLGDFFECAALDYGAAFLLRRWGFSLVCLTDGGICLIGLSFFSGFAQKLRQIGTLPDLPVAGSAPESHPVVPSMRAEGIAQ